MIPRLRLVQSHGLDWCKVVRAERCGLELDLFQSGCDRNFLFLGHDDLVLGRIGSFEIDVRSVRCKLGSYERKRDRQTETDEDTNG